MRTFINAYVLAAVLMYLLHKWLKWKEERDGHTLALQRMHDVVHNVGHLLRIILVVLLYYLIYKSVEQGAQEFAV